LARPDQFSEASPAVGTCVDGGVKFAEAPEWNPKKKIGVFKAINVNETYVHFRPGAKPFARR